jgi:hypothetical protein
MFQASIAAALEKSNSLLRDRPIKVVNKRTNLPIWQVRSLSPSTLSKFDQLKCIRVHTVGQQKYGSYGVLYLQVLPTRGRGGPRGRGRGFAPPFRGRGGRGARGFGRGHYHPYY